MYLACSLKFILDERKTTLRSYNNSTTIIQHVYDITQVTIHINPRFGLRMELVLEYVQKYRVVSYTL